MIYRLASPVYRPDFWWFKKLTGFSFVNHGADPLCYKEHQLSHKTTTFLDAALVVTLKKFWNIIKSNPVASSKPTCSHAC
jgi:hypothetical protein